VHVRHEEAAAFAAAGEAALTGELAVCAASCGPGNTHLINGLYDAAHRDPVTPVRRSASVVHPVHDELAAAAATLSSAGRVTILAGAGCAGAHGELMEAARILQAPVVHTLRGKKHVDYDNPYDVGMTGLHGFSSGYRLTDDQNPQDIVPSLVAAVPSGSYLTITNLTADLMDPDQAARATQAGQQGGITYVPRSEAEVAAFFDGPDFVDPGVVPMQAWRPNGDALADPHGPTSYAAMGRKP
jgi:hypothetical protein